MNTDRIRAYGYTSWLALYRDIVNQGLGDADRVSLTWQPQDAEHLTEPGGRNLSPDLVLYLQEIQANAFVELYAQLPEPATMGVVNDLVDLAELEPVNINFIKSFLNKLPTK